MEAEGKRDKVVTTHTVVSHEEWLAARKELLEKEKRVQKEMAEVALARQALPWERVSKQYTFRRAEDGAAVSLEELFGNGADQRNLGPKNLVVQHVMFLDDWTRPCMMCCAWTEQYAHLLPFLNTRTQFVVVMAAGHEKIRDCCKSKGWADLPAYSAGPDSEFSRDFGVSFTQEEIDSKALLYNYGKSAAMMREMHGFSVFRKEGGEIFHTYSTYSAGLSELSAALKLFDILPDGRAEHRNLDWVKHREDY